MSSDLGMSFGMIFFFEFNWIMVFGNLWDKKSVGDIWGDKLIVVKFFREVCYLVLLRYFMIGCLEWLGEGGEV